MIDAHAHLTDPRLANDLDDVLARATYAGVTRILSCGEDLPSSIANVAVADRAPLIRVAVGVHPHRAASWDASVAAGLRDLARDERVVAIGEIGLDLSGRSAPLEAQVRAFEGQLRLSLEVDLPVVVHLRDAGDQAREVIDRVAGVRGMIHCFSEGPAQVAGWVARGFALSFAGTVTYPKSSAIQAAARLCPGERLLTETDSPYLAPQRHRGRRNEPAYVAETLAAVAAARGENTNQVETAVAASAKRLFGARWG